MNRSTTSPSRAFTLLEMTLAVVILAIILLGMQSAITLVARSSPDRSGSGGAQLQTAGTVDQLSSDLSFALSFNTMTPTAVEFTVPDRNGDGAPETVRYSWTGIGGDPLLRIVNGGTAAPIALNVRHFQLTYDKRAQQRSTTYTESGEVPLASYEGDSGLLGLGGLADATITNSYFVGQYFKPTLPINASAWRLTRVRFKAHSHNMTGGLLGLLPTNNPGGAGITRVQARTASGGGLPSTVLDEATLAEATLGTAYTWQEFSFANAKGSAPGSGLCLVLQWSADPESCDIQYDTSASVANAWFVRSNNGGASWMAVPGQELQFYFYGTYSTPDPVAYDYFLTDVRCSLRTSIDPQRKLYATVRVVNEPQVTGP